MVLDLVFILNFSWGVAGAAYATVISQAVSAALCFVYMRRKLPILAASRDECKIDFRIMGRLLYMGLPMALQFSITAIGSIILQSAVNALGSSVVAAVTAAGKVQMIVTQPMETLGLTMATFCGQNLGAGAYRPRKGRRAQQPSHLHGLLRSGLGCFLLCRTLHFLALYQR